ncbi:MAG: hypothetical protein DRJ42_07985 [Deltaproteobacteria bacterium]|nr:MAG: hypothetical protein DRJ42_07985 [Deltaproteobacteria bacterium]
MRNAIGAALLLIVGCGGVQSEPAAPAPEAEPVAEADAPPASDRMQQHFTDVGIARDAVIQGDLEAVRAPLARIAAAEYGFDLPADWLQWVEEMQQSAGGYADSADLLAAANAVASLTESCADCHRTTLGGPAIAEETEPPHNEDLVGWMTTHAWGTEQLWIGLTAPSHEAWARGAAAIIGDGAISEAEGMNEALAPQLEAVQALGVRAREAGQPAEMAAVYAEILTSCADCHTALDGRR